MSFADVGKSYDTPEDLYSHLRALRTGEALGHWKPQGIVMHHTYFPDLSMRPEGFDAQLIKNAAHGYVHDRGWRSGPHLFIDDHKAWGMTPFTEPGTHAVSFNRTRFGVEVLGNYDTDADKESPRGRKCWIKAAQYVAAICAAMRWDATARTIVGHRDDGATDRTCPGTKIDLELFRDNVRGWLATLSFGKKIPPFPQGVDRVKVQESLASIASQVEKLRQMFGNS